MAVVLFGALLHAAWNVIVKAADDKLLDIVRVQTAAAVIAWPLVPFVPLPAPESWPFLAVSALVHCAYFSLVAAAYRSGDLSLAYPVMRGSAPLLTALLAVLLLDEQPGAFGWAGVAGMSLGMWLLAVDARRTSRHQLRSVAFGLVNALAIVAYTLIDGAGVRVAGSPWSYAVWLFALNAVPLIVMLVMLRGASVLPRLIPGRSASSVGGALTFGSYTATLWAMTLAPVALVAALREASVIFALALAALALRERFGATRLTASLCVAAGAAALKLA